MGLEMPLEATNRESVANGKRKENVPKATIVLFAILKASVVGKEKEKEKARARTNPDPNPRTKIREIKLLQEEKETAREAAPERRKIRRLSEESLHREKLIANPASNF